MLAIKMSFLYLKCVYYVYKEISKTKHKLNISEKKRGEKQRRKGKI